MNIGTFICNLNIWCLKTLLTEVILYISAYFLHVIRDEVCLKERGTGPISEGYCELSVRRFIKSI